MEELVEVLVEEAWDGVVGVGGFGDGTWWSRSWTRATVSNLLMIKGEKSISVANDLAKDTSTKIKNDANKMNNLFMRIPSKIAPLIIRYLFTQSNSVHILTEIIEFRGRMDFKHRTNLTIY